MYGGWGRLQTVGVLSGRVELLCWWGKNMRVSGFRSAAIKTNTYKDNGNKKIEGVSLQEDCIVLNVKRAQHISLGCALREFHFSKNLHKM